MEFGVIYDTDDKSITFDPHNRVKQELLREFNALQKREPKRYADMFEQSFWNYCEAVAKRMNIRLTVGQNGEPLFDFVSRNLRTVAGLQEYNDALSAGPLD